MSRDFDTFKSRAHFIAYLTERLAAALRVAKPGANLLCWALPRTSHWTGMAVEDAGWKIFDRVAHLFGSGFPKNKHLLKPAIEDWWLATKPGGAKWLGIEQCRISTAPADAQAMERCNTPGSGRLHPRDKMYSGQANGTGPLDTTQGRWPANVVLSHIGGPDGCVEVGTRRVKGTAPPGKPSRGQGRPKVGYSGIADNPLMIDYADPDGRETVAEFACVEGCPILALDLQAGERTSGSRAVGVRRGGENWSGHWNGDGGPAIESSTGSASRFFYCSKASQDDRGKGNAHPTVKNTDLMRWLCKLVTPERGTILDPFMGSGSTGIAAFAEGFSFIGIEQEEASYATAEARLAAARADRPLYDLFPD